MLRHQKLRKEKCQSVASDVSGKKPCTCCQLYQEQHQVHIVRYSTNSTRYAKQHQVQLHQELKKKLRALFSPGIDILYNRDYINEISLQMLKKDNDLFYIIRQVRLVQT
jgi:NifB/MoaA-like Fe-S oxidoreductase